MLAISIFVPLYCLPYVIMLAIVLHIHACNAVMDKTYNDYGQACKFFLGPGYKNTNKNKSVIHYKWKYKDYFGINQAHLP